MIQFKEKPPNTILLIPTITFTPFARSSNVLVTSLNLNNKNPNVLAIFIRSFH